VVRGELKAAEREFERKLGEGYHVVGGKLVSPDQLAQAVAEQEGREAAEQTRLEDQAQARAETEEKALALREAQQRALEEQQRRRREKEEAQRELKDALRALPSIPDVLEGFEYTMHRTRMSSALISLRLAKIDASKPFNLREFTAGKDDVLQLLRGPEAKKSTILVAYRDEILDFIKNLEFSAYLKSANEPKPDGIPVQFASYQDRPTLLLGTVFSDAVFDNVNLGMNTPEKRAVAFIQQTVLPVLLRSHPTARFKSAKLDYLGIVFAYATKNAARDDEIPEAEFLCIVMPTKDFAAFAQRALSPEGLFKKSAVFLAAGSEKFLRVEIALD